MTQRKSLVCCNFCRELLGIFNNWICWRYQRYSYRRAGCTVGATIGGLWHGVRQWLRRWSYGECIHLHHGKWWDWHRERLSIHSHRRDLSSSQGKNSICDHILVTVMNFVVFPLRQGRCGCSLVVVVIFPQVLWFASSVDIKSRAALFKAVLLKTGDGYSSSSPTVQAASNPCIVVGLSNGYVGNWIL